MGFDYRMLNKMTIKDAYALPRIEEVFDVIQGSKVFITTDLKSGYHLLEIEDAYKGRGVFTVGP